MVPKIYGNTRGSNYLIYVILEFDNTQLYSTFYLPRNFFNKLTWKEKNPEIVQLLNAICF